jgi:hypothetical protein
LNVLSAEDRNRRRVQPALGGECQDPRQRSLRDDREIGELADVLCRPVELID